MAGVLACRWKGGRGQILPCRTGRVHLPWSRRSLAQRFGSGTDFLGDAPTPCVRHRSPACVADAQQQLLQTVFDLDHEPNHPQFVLMLVIDRMEETLRL